MTASTWDRRAEGLLAPGHWGGRRALGETTLTNVALLGVGAATGILAARILGPAGRGSLALALAISGMSTVVMGLGLQQALAYTVAGRPASAQEALRLSAWLSALSGGLVILIGSPVAGAVITNPSTSDAVKLGLLAVPLSLFAGNITGILQGLRLSRWFNLLRLVTPAIYAAGLLLAFLFVRGISPVEVVGIYAVATALGAALAYVSLKPTDRILGLPRAGFVRDVVRYGAVVGAGSIAYAANKQLALVVLGAVSPLRDVGLYAVAMGYALPVGVIATAIALHTLPDIAAAKDDATAVARRRIRTAAVTTIPLTVVAVVVAPTVIPFVYGEGFADSVGAAQLLALGGAVLGVAHVLSEILRGVGRPGVPALAEGIGAAGTLAALPLVVPKFGITGAAFASLGVYVVVLVVLYVGSRALLVGELD